MEISIRLTPCIQPVNTAVSPTEAAAEDPVSTLIPRAAAAPTPKKIPAQRIGFIGIFRYTIIASLLQRMPNIGIITPVRIDVVLLS